MNRNVAGISKEVVLENGIKRRLLSYGENSVMVQIFIPAGEEVVLHKHIYEQIGYVLQGKAIMKTETDAWEVSAGDGYCFLGNDAHGTVALKDTIVVEAFTPLRKEYLI